MDPDSGRFFIAFDIEAPWPEKWPHGRILAPEDRHLTLAFLGNCSRSKILERMPLFPTPPFRLGPVGCFDKFLPLPPRYPRAATWHAHWLRSDPLLYKYQQDCNDFLTTLEYTLDSRPWKPHVTLARKPFSLQDWKETFRPLPFYASSLNLYESLGECRYRPIWEHPFIPPFEKIKDAPNLSYEVRGKNLTDIFSNAQTALAFSFPELTPTIEPRTEPESRDSVILSLKQWITQVDATISGSTYEEESMGLILGLKVKTTF